MGTPVSFSDSDLLRDKVLSAGWYILSLQDYNEAQSKDGGSLNQTFESLVVSDASGDTEFAGVPIRVSFNSKAPGFAIGFLRALGIPVESGKRYDLEQAKGQLIQAYIRVGSYNDRPKNEVTHAYRPMQS